MAAALDCRESGVMAERYASARTINPEAGEHPIAASVAELAAAEAATRLSWRDFPYYAKRYGERGWRFSLSDSGWLQTLFELSLDAAKAQVLWLGNLLAARGMPRYLLERHLGHLHDELIAAAPEKTARYAFLNDLAAHLRKLRNASIPAETFEKLSSEFEARVGGGREVVKNMGNVLVAAVADDHGGIGNVLTSVTAWATDAKHFGPEWIAAVQATIEQARAATTSSASLK
jgi:hypothetical protein